MKELQSESKLRKKVTLTQRSRQYLKEEEGKKKPVTSEELEKIKKFDRLLDHILNKIDAFTIDSFDISSYHLKKPQSLVSEDKDCSELFKEYITEPQKQKKSKPHLGFAECKKKFDLVLNREDPEQNALISARFDFYNSILPASACTLDKIEFLKGIPLVSLAQDRKRVLESAQKFKVDPPSVVQAQSSKCLAEKIIESDCAPSYNLSSSDKLLLLRSMVKYFGDWDKIEKEFREKPVSVEVLKKIWRCLKVTMMEEVAELKKKAPNFHYIKWLRAAIRKMELGSGKKGKNKNVNSFNLKPREQRLDMLSIMADAENAKRFGIESSTYLNFTASSSFKVYGNENI